MNLYLIVVAIVVIIFLLRSYMTNTSEFFSSPSKSCSTIVAAAFVTPQTPRTPLSKFAGTTCIQLPTTAIVPGVGAFGQFVYDGDTIVMISEISMNKPFSLVRVMGQNFVVEIVCQKSPISTANPLSDSRQIVMQNTFFRLLDTTRQNMLSISSASKSATMVPITATATTNDVFYFDMKDPSNVQKALNEKIVQNGYPLCASGGVVLHSALSSGSIVSFDSSGVKNVGIWSSTSWANYGISICKIGCTDVQNCFSGPPCDLLKTSSADYSSWFT